MLRLHEVQFPAAIKTPKIVQICLRGMSSHVGYRPIHFFRGSRRKLKIVLYLRGQLVYYGKEVLALGRGFLPAELKPDAKFGRALPTIVVRDVGRGKVVVIGDTGLAMNKNLERRDGRPFEGMRENSDFWRWLLARLRGRRTDWLPAQVRPPATRPADPEGAAP